MIYIFTNFVLTIKLCNKNTIIIFQSKFPTEEGHASSSTVTILISKYLSISFFCLSFLTMILTVIFLSIWYQKAYKNQCYRSSVYIGSNISLDSFDSEGYLRPQIDDIYDEVL